MISKTDVQKLAGLARIKLSSSEDEKFAKEIDGIVGYIDQIQKFKGSGDTRVVGRVKNVLRDDNSPHESGAYSKEILDEAPAREGDYVKVKKIL